jgi:serine/threonine protein kinase
LKNISKLKEWPLYNVLLEKYRLKENEARSFTSFIGKMIQWKPKDRASAREMLEHPWLKERDDYDVWMSKNHLNEYRTVNIKQFPEYKKKLHEEKKEEEKYRKKRENEMLGEINSNNSKEKEVRKQLD